MIPRPSKAVAAGFALIVISNFSLATGLKQKGAPEVGITAMSGYGVSVSTRTALKSVVPSGWRLYIHQSAKLPETMSWRMGEPWTNVLGEMANTSQLAVLVDWEARTVLIRTPEVALDEQSTRQEIQQAATTPLPKFGENNKVAAKGPVDASVGNSAGTPNSASMAEAGTVVWLSDVAVTREQELEKAALAQRKTLDSLPLVKSESTPSSKTLAPDSRGVKAASIEEPKTATGGKALPISDSKQASTKPLATYQGEERRQKGASNRSNEAIALNSPAGHQASLETDRIAVAEVREPAYVPKLPVVRSNPTKEMVARQEAAVAKNPPKFASTSEFAYTQAVALNRAPARTVAQSIARKFGLRLVWAAPEVQMQGPVTLLARDASEDVHLLQKALGVYSEIKIELSPDEKVLRVVPSKFYLRGANSAMAVEEFLAQQRNKANSNNKAKDLSPLVLKVVAGEPLETALVRFAAAQGFTLEWKVEGGFEANRDMVFEGIGLVQVLSEALPPLGLSADVYTRDNHIVVRPGEGRDR